MHSFSLKFGCRAQFAAAVFGALFGLTAMVGDLVAGGTQDLYVENGIALSGYDPVAYHTQEDAVMGSDQYTVEWQGAVWYFVNQDHADSFASEPEKYQPRYGGFCAFGVAKGYRMKPDMTAWEIHDGQLYLYFDESVGDDFAEDRSALTQQADTNWPSNAVEVTETE